MKSLEELKEMLGIDGNATKKEVMEFIKDNINDDMAPPLKKKFIDNTSIIDLCDEYIESVMNGGRLVDEHYFFETAMMMVYGDKIFDWVNNFNN